MLCTVGGETTNDAKDTNEKLNAEDAEKNPLFPTLEEQRAADWLTSCWEWNSKSSRRKNLNA